MDLPSGGYDTGNHPTTITFSTEAVSIGEDYLRLVGEFIAVDLSEVVRIEGSAGELWQNPDRLEDLKVLANEDGS